MYTKGYWHNQNGAPIVTDDGLYGLDELCLVDGNGNAFNPESSSFESGFKLADDPLNLSPWLIDGGSGDTDHARENFAQQLAAFYLNVQHCLGGGADYFIYAPSIGNTGPGGDYISAADLITVANDALCEGFDSSLHDLLDDANNNRIGVYTFPTEPPSFSY